jgi:hypothetical protein
MGVFGLQNMDKKTATGQNLPFDKKNDLWQPVEIQPNGGFPCPTAR